MGHAVVCAGVSTVGMRFAGLFEVLQTSLVLSPDDARAETANTDCLQGSGETGYRCTDERLATDR